jgi:L-serine dehydratase
MAVSVFDIFKIGIGPSSSHTVGPMRAAKLFTNSLIKRNLLASVTHLEVELFGSLGLTGRGHGSDKAILLGLIGEEPDTVDPDTIASTLKQIHDERQISIQNKHLIAFQPKKDLVFHLKQRLPHHPNGLRFLAFGSNEQELLRRDYYSVGGGFVVNHDEQGEEKLVDDNTPQPFEFHSGAELLAHCTQNKMSIRQLMIANEKVWRTEEDICAQLLKIWEVMQACVARGCNVEGVLPGGLKVQRRAPTLYRELTKRPERSLRDPLSILDWVNLYALAVNEENAAGGRVVTAPTNGAAGIIPAVLNYYDNFCPNSNNDGILTFLLTAGAIALLYKENASISGAEVGCQGEVGVACSMAAGGLAAALGGTMEQVENAAEIGMEHNLGLTCDPVGSLVQIPCIERNAMGAVKAINAQRLAFRGDGKHFVSLDKVIKTMRDTGRDMRTKYKETSRGGLAVNVTECLVITIGFLSGVPNATILLPVHDC